MDKNITITGKEAFLVRRKLNEILIELETTDDDILTYDLESDDLHEVIEELTTVPFFTDKKVIILNNPLFLEKDNGYDYFIDYLKKPLETSYLIINASGIKWSKTNKYVKSLELYTKIYSIKEVDDLKKYALDFLQENKCKIDKDALEELLGRVKDINFLYQELTKLILYSDNKDITLKDVQVLVSVSLEDNVFELVNAFLERDKKKTFCIYANLIKHNEDPLKIMNALIRKFLEIVNTKLLLKQKATKEEVASYFKVTSGRAYYMIKNANQITSDDLYKYINYLADLDFSIKSGRIDKNIGLELFLLR